MLSFRLDFTGKKCGDLNRVNRNVIVDETAIVFVFVTQLVYQCDLWLMVVCLRKKKKKLNTYEVDWGLNKYSHST